MGASNIDDSRRSDSNFGPCVDIFAPGSNITSTWTTSNTATNTISGTSMASPHVAGVIALILQGNPDVTPREIETYLINTATGGALSDIGPGSPNKLLYKGTW